VANHHGTLSAAFNEALNEGQVATNPCRGVRLPRKDSHTDIDDDMCFLTPEELTMIVGQLGELDKPIPWILARTGLRWSELTALQVGDVDLMAKPPRLKVVRAWKRDAAGGYKVGPPKTPRSRRTITLDAATFELLLPLVTARPAGAWVITTRDGVSPMPHATFMRHWHRVLYGIKPRTVDKKLTAEQVAAIAPEERLDRLGLVGTGVLEKRPRIHDLRHTHASWLLSDPTVSMYRLQRRLGHESITTTEGTYGHLRIDEDAAILGALDAVVA
jgi:integrase